MTAPPESLPAFAPLAGGLPARPRVCGGGACARAPPAMKGKGGKRKAKASKAPKAAAPKAAAPQGAGFGRAAGGEPAQPKKPADAAEDEVVVAGVDGSIGDSTPKRAFRAGGRAQMADPLKEVALMEEAASDVGEEDGDAAMAAEVARLAEVRRRAAAVAAIVPDPALRWPWTTTHDEAVEMLAVARRDGCLDDTVVANRDFVTFRMLYRFTSAILQAEGEGAAEEAANMRTLRAEVIDTCWHFDRPLRDELFSAEARLVQVLQAPEESNTLGEVEARAGVTDIQVNAFWLVVYGAVAAWELREAAAAAASQDAAQQADIQLRLKNVAAALAKSDAVGRALSPALAAVGDVLTAPDEAAQTAVIGGLADETVVKMRTVLEQVRLWPQNAYGPFVAKLQAIVDYAIPAVTPVTANEGLQPFRFDPVDIERSSRLVEVTSRNKKSGGTVTSSVFNRK